MVELITGYLTENDVQVTGAHDGTSALFAARQADVDAVVLDLMLPGMSGTEVCQQLRREGNDVPILMLTARGAVAERVAGPRGRRRRLPRQAVRAGGAARPAARHPPPPRPRGRPGWSWATW